MWTQEAIPHPLRSQQHEQTRPLLRWKKRSHRPLWRATSYKQQHRRQPRPSTSSSSRQHTILVSFIQPSMLGDMDLSIDRPMPRLLDLFDPGYFLCVFLHPYAVSSLIIYNQH